MKDPVTALDYSASYIPVGEGCHPQHASDTLLFGPNLDQAIATYHLIHGPTGFPVQSMPVEGADAQSDEFVLLTRTWCWWPNHRHSAYLRPEAYFFGVVVNLVPR